MTSDAPPDAAAGVNVNATVNAGAAVKPAAGVKASAMAPPPPRSVLTSSFSLLSAGLTSPSEDGLCLLVFGGGGGASKTGVPNAMLVTKLTR
jgi:hypothetical protein